MAQVSKATGIIIRKIDYSNTSLILHLLTSNDGILHLIVRGAKKQKSPFAGKLEFFSEVICDYIIVGKSELYILKECSSVNRFTALSHNIELFYMASFMVEVIGSVPWDTAGASDAYIVLKDLFCAMENATEERYTIILLYFMIKFLDLLGVLPSVTDCLYSHCSLEEEVIPIFSPHVGFINYRFSSQVKSALKIMVVNINVIRRLYETFLSNSYDLFLDKNIPVVATIRRLNTIFMGFIHEEIGRNIKSTKLLKVTGLLE